MKTFAVILIIFLLVGLIASRKEQQRLAVYWNRACSGKHWRRRFPDASKAEIRRFLDIVIRAFGFKKIYRLRFDPDDCVLQIYDTVYPPQWRIADAMELESLALDLHRTYDLDVESIWHKNITLGELFTFTQKKKA